MTARGIKAPLNALILKIRSIVFFGKLECKVKAPYTTFFERFR
jgi:hypothetical protein